MKNVVYVEGNISSGKSTIIESLRERGYTVFEEPLESWLTEYKLGDSNILDLLYKNMREYGFKFECMSMVTRYEQLIRALEDTTAKTVVIERSYMVCRRVFAQNLYNNGLIDELEWKIYTQAHAMFTSLIQRVLAKYNITVIYIRTTPDECYKRKIGRDRVEESGVPPAYFGELHELHDEWLLQTDPNYVLADVQNNQNTKIHIIDGDAEHDEVLQLTLRYLKSL